MTPFDYVPDSWLVPMLSLIWLAVAVVTMMVLAKRRTAITPRAVRRGAWLLALMFVGALIGGLFFTETVIELLFGYHHGGTQGLFSFAVAATSGAASGMLVGVLINAHD